MVAAIVSVILRTFDFQIDVKCCRECKRLASPICYSDFPGSNLSFS